MLLPFFSKISTCVHTDRELFYFYMQKLLVMLQMQYSQQYRNMKYSLLADTSSVLTGGFCTWDLFGALEVVAF